MNWEDTMLGPEIVSPKFTDYIPCAVWDVLGTQAKITWDIAYNQALKDNGLDTTTSSVV